MSRIDRKVRGTVRFELCGACPESVLNACAMQALELMDLESIDACTLRVTVFENRAEEFQALSRRCMCETEKLSQSGGSKSRRLVKRRMLLLIFALLTAGLLFLSSLFIWDIQVVGCQKLTQAQVLRALSGCGVEQGSFRFGLNSDLVRSRILVELPEIAWMTVNVRGSRATVLILEREEKPEIYEEADAADIVAAKTGVIAKMSVLSGKPQVTPGQAVVEGELLVSGTMDSITALPRQVRAAGSVTAETWTELSAVRPAVESHKTGQTKKIFRFALKFGEKRINLYVSGRNELDECDKIVYEYKIGIEGLFLLPVSIIKEELSFYETEAQPSAAGAEMEEALRAYLTETVDGEVLSADFSVNDSGELLCVTMHAHCLENIAETREVKQEES